MLNSPKQSRKCNRHSVSVAQPNQFISYWYYMSSGTDKGATVLQLQCLLYMGSKGAMARKDTWWKEGSLTALKVLGSKIDNTSHPLTTLCPEPFTLTCYQKGFRKCWRTEKMFWVSHTHLQWGDYLVFSLTNHHKETLFLIIRRI